MDEGHDDHDEGRPAYDPHNPELPAREPPLRSTAPQSEYTMAQVGFGALVLLVGLALTVGVAVVVA